jgi:hypothetical protein
METLLNLLWVVIAATATIIWRTRWAQVPRRIQRKPLEEWTALACALVLLFFAVSLTDDLHAEIILAEDCFAGRRHSPTVGPSCHSAKTLRGTAPAVFHYELTTMPLTEFGIVVVVHSAVISHFNFAVTSGRAPPSFLPQPDSHDTKSSTPALTIQS